MKKWMGGSKVKEKQFIEVVEPQEEDLGTLFEQYNIYTKMESDLKKKKASIKEKLKNYFDSSGLKDDYGNIWLSTPNGRFKKEIRRKLTIDPMFADPILKRLDIFEKVVTYEPVYDVEVLQNYIADGTLTEEDVAKIFKTEESYAIKTETEKKKEEN